MNNDTYTYASKINIIKSLRALAQCSRYIKPLLAISTKFYINIYITQQRSRVAYTSNNKCD